MIRVIIDTDIFVDHLRGNERARDFLRKVEDGEINGFFSTITEAELYSGRKMDSVEEQQKVGRLLGIMNRVNLDSGIARKAGELRRKWGILLPDAIIAATALTKKAKIATKNVKHYRSIKTISLEIPY